MPTPVFYDLAPLPPEFFYCSVSVERQASVGQDASGATVEGVTTTYSSLACAIVPLDAKEKEELEQRYQDVTHQGFFPVLPSTGTLPDIRLQDRVVFGTRPDGSIRYLGVEQAYDEASAGLLLVALLREVVQQ